MTEIIAENGTYWANRGLIEQNLDFLLKANKYFEKALELEPSGAEIYRILALCCYDISQMQPTVSLRFDFYMLAENNLKKAEELGVASKMKLKYWERQRERRDDFYKEGDEK